MKKTTLIALFAAFLALLLIFTKNEKKENAYPRLESHSTILAFGDSLTFGYGVSIEGSYPSVLSEKSGIRVINAGLSGEESLQGLKRLPSFLSQKPDLVILCHGGNDILRKRSRATLKANLRSMINIIHESGAKVLLVGVPDFGMLGFSTLPLYEELADETGVMYEGEILSEIESDVNLKSDRIHPNEAGYAMMAETFLKVLQRHGVLEPYE